MESRLKGLLVSAMRFSGQGGAGLTGRHLWPTLEKGRIVDSLASTLKEIGLKLRVGDCSKGAPLMASRHEGDIDERT